MTFEKGGVEVTVDVLYPANFQSMRHQSCGIAENAKVRVYDRDVKEQFITLNLTLNTIILK